MFLGPVPLSPSQFAGIQSKLCLDDAALGAKLFRVQNGAEIVRDYRTGARTVSIEVSAAMLQIEEDFEAARVAGGRSQIAS
ncbi:MAG: hypothetical protein AB7J28_15775 [Hyphomonadaceae bacterium]